jgi:hypothetical protein
MKTMLRSFAGLIIGIGLCVSVAAPAFAGYGNHAERATANIKTRIGIAKISIETELAEIQALAESKVPSP